MRIHYFFIVNEDTIGCYDTKTLTQLETRLKSLGVAYSWVEGNNDTKTFRIKLENELSEEEAEDLLDQLRKR